MYMALVIQSNEDGELKTVLFKGLANLVQLK